MVETLLLFKQFEYKKTKILASFLGLFGFSYVYSQQAPQFSQYLQNSMVINPAITGTEDYIDFTVAYRDQWTGFDGAPRTGTFSFNAPSSSLFGRNNRAITESHSGIGAFFYTDKTGPIDRSGYYASYAYHLRVSEEWFVSMGTFIGATQFRFDESKVVLVQNPNDVLVQNISTTNFDMSVGLYAYSKYLFAGLSANQLFDDEIPYEVTSGILTSGKINRNYNFLLGSRIEIDQDWNMVPSTFIRYTDNAPVQWDISTKFEYQNKLWGGISYRNEESVYALAGFKLWDSLSVGYSYDYPISNFRGNQSGSHEIVISYRLLGGNNKCGCPVNSQ